MVYDERKSRPEVKVEPEAHWGSRTGAEFTLCVGTAYAANTQGKVNLWIDLRTVNGVKFTDVAAGRDLSAEEADSEDGVNTGACVRVNLQVNNIHTVNATL